MRSVRRKLTALACGLATASVWAVALSGCQTTQDAAARVHVRSARELASREKLALGQPSATVKAGDVTLFRDGDRLAVAVKLSNTGGEAAHDLPIAVGLRGPDGKTPLNDRHVDYFQSHIPAIDSGAQATWVFAGEDPAPSAEQAYAEVGTKTADVGGAPVLPSLDVSASPEKHGGSNAVTAEVTNPNDFPQYDVEVYAWATKDGRYVAAGAASTGDMDAGETEQVTVKLIGDPKGADLHLAAPPTIFE